MPAPRSTISTRVLLLCWLFALTAAGHVFFNFQRYDQFLPGYWLGLYAPACLLVFGVLLAVVVRALWHRDWRPHLAPFVQLTLCASLLWLAPKLGHRLFALKENHTRVHAYEILARLETWKTTHGSYPPTLAHLDLRTPVLARTFPPFNYQRTTPTNYHFSAHGGGFLLTHSAEGTTHYSPMVLCR